MLKRRVPAGPFHSDEVEILRVRLKLGHGGVLDQQCIGCVDSDQNSARYIGAVSVHGRRVCEDRGASGCSTTNATAPHADNGTDVCRSEGHPALESGEL